MVVWIIGMSASGKTTLAREVLKILRASGEPWLHLDGDRLRSILGGDLGHTLPERRKLGQRMVNLCSELDAQNLNVLASILSIFPDQRSWLRDNASAYREIFLDVPMEVLRRRGIEKPPSLTPLEFAHVAPGDAVRRVLGELATAHNELRYGGRKHAATRMLILLEELESAAAAL